MSALLGKTHFRNMDTMRFLKFVAIVPQGEEHVLEKFGKFNKVVSPGIQFYWPFIQQVAYKVPHKELCFQINPQNAITKDNVMVTIAGTLYVKFIDSYKASYGADEPKSAIIQHAQSSMRAQIGSMTLDDIFRERNSINLSIYESINKTAEKWGAIVSRFELTEVAPSDRSVSESLHLQATAERNRRATVKDAEAKKQAMELEADAYKYQTEIRAAADATSIRLLAEANAEAANLRSDAERYNIQVLDDVFANSISNVNEYMLQCKSIDAWRNIARESSVVVVPGDASALIGAATAALKSAASVIPSTPDKLA